MIRRGPGGPRRRPPTRRCGSSAPWRSPSSSSGSAPPPSCPCCPSTSATWAARTPWPGWSWPRSSPPACSSSTRWAGWPTASAASPCSSAGLVIYASASFAFLLPIAAGRGHRCCAALQGLGAGGRRGGRPGHGVGCRGRRAARSGLRLHLRRPDLAGMAVGPADRGIVGVHHMWVMFLGSGVMSPRPPASPPSRIHEPGRACRRGAGGPAPRRRHAGPPRRSGGTAPWPVPWSRPRRSASPPASTTSAGPCCWCPGGRGAGRSASRGRSSPCPSWSPPGPSGWLADHMDRRVLVLAGVGAGRACSAPPTRSSTCVPALDAARGHRGTRLRRRPARASSRCSPRGRIRPRSGASRACSAPPRRRARRCPPPLAGAAFALARWLPFLTAVPADGGGAHGDAPSSGGRSPATSTPGSTRSTWAAGRPRGTSGSRCRTSARALRRWRPRRSGSAPTCSRRTSWPCPGPWTGTRGTHAPAPRWAPGRGVPSAR